MMATFSPQQAGSRVLPPPVPVQRGDKLWPWADVPTWKVVAAAAPLPVVPLFQTSQLQPPFSHTEFV